LLVVIGIIALLLAILLPITQRVRNHARAVACQAHLGQWGVITAIYVNENNGKLPRLDGWMNSWSWRDGNYQPMGGHLVPGLDINYYDNDFVLCPVARRWRFDPDRQTNDRINLLYYPGSKLRAWCYFSVSSDGRMPGPGPTIEIFSSYGFNNHLSEFSPDRYPRLPRSNVPYLFDSAHWRVAVWPTSEPPAYDDEPPDIREGGGPGSITFGSHMKAVCLDRHSGAVNSLFLDWSVRRVGLKELWTLKWHEKFDTANKWTKAGGVEPEDWPQWMHRFKDY
jgi:prepilin-type processing-associated H-X9-DG protein